MGSQAGASGLILEMSRWLWPLCGYLGFLSFAPDGCVVFNSAKNNGIFGGGLNTMGCLKIFPRTRFHWVVILGDIYWIPIPWLFYFQLLNIGTNVRCQLCKIRSLATSPGHGRVLQAMASCSVSHIPSCRHVSQVQQDNVHPTYNTPHITQNKQKVTLNVRKHRTFAWKA